MKAEGIKKGTTTSTIHITLLMGHHPACHASLGSSFRDVPTVVRYIVKKNTYMGFVKDLSKFHISSPRQIKPDTLRKSLESVPSWIEQIRSWTEKFILGQKEDTKQPKLSRSTPSEPMQFASPPQSLKSATHHMFIREILTATSTHKPILKKNIHKWTLQYLFQQTMHTFPLSSVKEKYAPPAWWILDSATRDGRFFWDRCSLQGWWKTSSSLPSPILLESPQVQIITLSARG